ncbi:MAG: DUF6125 family protein [Dehalococcoidia bacterium]|nr:DUF6125 family protein [Dehalococcoidia bacterium]
MLKTNLESLSKKTLIDIIEMLGKNWISVDGFWYMGVEDTFGSEAALKLDVKMWERQSVLEGRRLKKVLGLEGGMEDVLKALDFVNCIHGYPDFEIEEEAPNRSVLVYKSCPVQEARLRLGRGEFACKEPAYLCYANTAAAVDPRAKVRCVSAPPDERSSDIWCRWEVIIENP